MGRSQPVPPGPAPQPPVQRLRVRFAKRGRLRFASHLDVARAIERAARRTGLPVAFSAGFTPHPKISYLGAAPTGVALMVIAKRGVLERSFAALIAELHGAFGALPRRAV